MKVLIVDDDRVSRMLLGHIIGREFGGAITEAIHGAEALEVLKRQTFDFILLDLMMPVMDGLQTLEAIRANDALRSVPVVILSAVKEEGKVRRILQLGVTDYLAKPLQPKGIVQRLHRIVPPIMEAKAARGDAGEADAPPIEAESLRPLVEIVVADADPIFRSFVRNTLGREYRIIDAETGSKALRRCQEARPMMLLLGEGLGAVDRALVLRKVKAEPELKKTIIVGLVPPPRNGMPGRNDAAPSDPLCEITLSRTFVPAAFREQFAKIARSIEKVADSGGTGEIVAGVRLELVSTVEQVFGMMLGVDVEQLSAHPQIPGTWISAEVALTLLHEDFTLGVVCACPAETGNRIATMMQSTSSDWVGNDLAAAALGDIAAIIAERLQRTLAEQGRRVQSSVAAVKRGPARGPEQALLRLSFNSNDGDLPFHVAVSGDRQAVPAGTMTHTARTM
jgi:CheY-like chemotaxis protein/CheY-specific phosphatase CheX